MNAKSVWGKSHKKKNIWWKKVFQRFKENRRRNWHITQKWRQTDIGREKGEHLDVTFFYFLATVQSSHTFTRHNQKSIWIILFTFWDSSFFCLFFCLQNENFRFHFNYLSDFFFFCLRSKRSDGSGKMTGPKFLLPHRWVPCGQAQKSLLPPHVPLPKL